ncbi:MAG: FGGY-family carbohydrate kinase [bacterium]|nr:FGGY-family carbohydrate kinase [bacterium]
MSLMSIDIGTTGCKVIAFSAEGKIIAQAYREYPLIQPKPGWMELNSRDVWEKVASAIREVTAQTKKDPVKALAVSSQGEAVTPVLQDGTVLDNAITTFDSRTAGLEKRWVEKYGREEILRITGVPPGHITTPPKLLWLKENKPEVYDNAWKFLCFEDFAYFKLGLDAAIDLSLAGRSMMLDIEKKDWSDEVLGEIDFDKERLATVVPSGTEVGKIGKKVAEHLGLPEGTLAVAGGHDQPAGALGSGVIAPNLAMDATGTVECVTAAFTEHIVNEKIVENNLCSYPHTVDGMFVCLAYNFTGGCLLRWFRDTFGQQDVAEARRRGVDPYEIILANIPDEPTRLLLLPHFGSTGTPYLDPNPTSAIIGLDLATKREEVIKAILEGITMEIKLNLRLMKEAGMDVKELRAIGGGAKSEKWLQLKADIFDREVLALDVSEAASLGMAMLAGVAVGEFKNVREAVSLLVKEKKRFFPNKTKAAKYEEKFEKYRKLYPLLKQL